MDDRARCVECCRARGLELLDFDAGTDGGSRFVAHVRDAQGRNLLLKRPVHDRAAVEVAALRAWNESGHTARLIEEIDNDIYLAEWIDGPSLADLPHSQSADFEAIGGMLRSLHSVPPPDVLGDVRDRVSVAGWRYAAPELIEIASGSASRLKRLDVPAVMLHGDLVPTNVVISSTGPRVIDPFATRGLAAWDIAQLAAASSGRGRRRVLAPFLQGYGARPEGLADMYSWMLLWFLERNLAAGRVEFQINLLPIAQELLRAGDSEAFLRLECGAG